MLRVLAIVDGRAGHDKQTFGIIAALRRRQPVFVTEVKVDLSLRGKIVAFIQFLFPFLAPLQKKEREADLILCTGGKTHFPALMRKRKYSLPLCTCMTPGIGFRSLFDFCFVPEHDNAAAAPNIVTTLGPPNLSKDKGCHQQEKGLILIGGKDKDSHIWEENRLLEEIEVLLKESTQKVWFISSSPRTPQSTVEKLQAFASTLSGVYFYHYKETPAGWVEEQYAQSSVIWVTADSISMVYEALTAGCMVGLFPMNWKSPQSKFARNERLLEQRGLVTSFPRWKKEKKYFHAEHFNEAQRCADIILEKWWVKN